MRIINKTNKKVLVNNAILLKNTLSKALGLMFSPKIKDKALIFVFDKEKIISLHMLFVFFPIDVLFLDQKKKVVEMKKNFKPFTFYNPKNKAKYVIELPENIISKTKTKSGDTLIF